MSPEEMAKLIADLRADVDAMRAQPAPAPAPAPDTHSKGDERVDKSSNMVLSVLALTEAVQGLPESARKDIMSLANVHGIEAATQAAKVAKLVTSTSPVQPAIPRGVGATTPPAGSDGWPTTIAEYRKLREKDREGAQALLRAGLNLSSLKER